MGYAEDMSQLALVAAVGSGTAADRAARLQGAVERLNNAARNLRTIVADVDWDGEAALAARDAFQRLAGTLNEHADAVNAVAAADVTTDAPFDQAVADHHLISSLVDDPGSVYYDQAGRSFDEYRADLAQNARSALSWGMSRAGSAVRAAASWDLEVPPAGPAPVGNAPGGGVTGTVPPGSSRTTTPGGVDPVPPVTGTVPAGSSGPATPGGVDPIPPVTGTVPAGSSGPATTPGGVDPIPPVTGTTDLGVHTVNSIRDPAELRRRLGG